jgi:hypothetical protein
MKRAAEAAKRRAEHRKPEAAGKAKDDKRPAPDKKEGKKSEPTKKGEQQKSGNKA